MQHIYSVLLLHLQIAKYKGFLIKIKVFIGFSNKLKVLKDFNEIKGFKGSPRVPAWSISTKECCRSRRGLNPRPPGLQSDGASNWATETGLLITVLSLNCQTL